MSHSSLSFFERSAGRRGPFCDRTRQRWGRRKLSHRKITKMFNLNQTNFGIQYNEVFTRINEVPIENLSYFTLYIAPKTLLSAFPLCMSLYMFKPHLPQAASPHTPTIIAWSRAVASGCLSTGMEQWVRMEERRPVWFTHTQNCCSVSPGTSLMTSDTTYITSASATRLTHIQTQTSI